MACGKKETLCHPHLTLQHPADGHLFFIPGTTLSSSRRPHPSRHWLVLVKSFTPTQLNPLHSLAGDLRFMAHATTDQSTHVNWHVPTPRVPGRQVSLALRNLFFDDGVVRDFRVAATGRSISRQSGALNKEPEGEAVSDKPGMEKRFDCRDFPVRLRVPREGSSHTLEQLSRWDVLSTQLHSPNISNMRTLPSLV